MQRIANLVDLEKCEKNAPLLATIRFDTAENEPSKVCRIPQPPGHGGCGTPMWSDRVGRGEKTSGCTESRRAAAGRTTEDENVFRQRQENLENECNSSLATLVHRPFVCESRSAINPDAAKTRTGDITQNIPPLPCRACSAATDDRCRSSCTTKICRGPVSGGSKPLFAAGYDQIFVLQHFQELQKLHTSAPLQINNFSNTLAQN